MIIIKQKNTKIFIPIVTLIIVITIITVVAIVNTHTETSKSNQTTQITSQETTKIATTQFITTSPATEETTVIETTIFATEKMTTYPMTNSVTEPITHKQPQKTKTQTQINTEPAQIATEKPKQTKTRPQGPYGTWGRLFIPSVNIDVALYQTPCTPEAQQIVDAYDSAAYMNTLNGAVLIGDHSNQGFDRLINVQAGTKMYIYRADGSVETYVCTETCRGTNYTSGVCDSNGVSSEKNSGIWCYTCGTSSTNIIISKFQKE